MENKHVNITDVLRDLDQVAVALRVNGYSPTFFIHDVYAHNLPELKSKDIRVFTIKEARSISGFFSGFFGTRDVPPQIVEIEPTSEAVDTSQN